MERDAILGHGIADFLRESIMKRADGYETIVCNGCGTIPIYNEREGLTICTMCDGPVKYIGETANTLEILPPLKRSVATFSKIEIPYAFKLLDQEMNAYLNMGMRVLTEKDVKHFRGPPRSELTADEEERLLSTVLPQRVLLDTEVPEMIAPTEEPEVKPEDLTALGLTEEEEVAEAPPAVTTTISAIGPATNSFTIQLPAGMTAPSASDTLQETSMDDVPFTEEEISAPASEPVAANNARSNGVNVQTTSQPVLVIPMNIGTAAPTEAISPPMPGAPTTLAVDTSERAMRGLNLPATGQNRRSNSGNRAVGSAPARANAVVNVQREGSTTPTNSNPNVRVSVTKQG
jgi:hypothetical protein